MKERNEFSWTRVKVSLMNVNTREKLILKRLGGVTGQTVSREIVIPDDMPLWALHYAITASFGLLNAHTHCFELTEKDYEKMTGGSSLKWAELSGKLFRNPYMSDASRRWADSSSADSSLQSWRRKKYTGPYKYHGKEEDAASCRKVASSFSEDDSQLVAVYRTSGTLETLSYVCRLENYKPYSGGKERTETLRFNALSVQQLGALFEDSCFEIIEKMSVKDFISQWANRIVYKYRSSDNWTFLLEFTGDEPPKDARVKCLETHRPVMITSDGLNLVEDIGGVHGYCQFLLSLYGSEKDKYDFEGVKCPPATSDEFRDDGYGNFRCRADALAYAQKKMWSEKLPELAKRL